MGEREEHVYQAKLAEQAERYDGEPRSVGWEGAGRPGTVSLSVSLSLSLCGLTR